MKTKFFFTDSKIKYILYWILIYAVVLGACFCVTLTAIYFSNKHMVGIASYDLEYYMETDTFNPNVLVNGANNLVFNENGEIIDGSPLTDESAKWNTYIKKIMPKLQESDYLYTLALTNDIEKTIAILVAYPMKNGGVFLFFREPLFLQRALLIIIIVVSLLILFMALCMNWVITMSKKNQKMQRDYVDNITHELKSPISSVRALTSAIYDGLVEDENKRKDYCSIMLNELNGLERTVSDMLELSRIQNNLINCEKTNCSAIDVFGAVIEKRRTLCEDLNIDFQLCPQLDIYPIINTNKALAARMMDILLDNAIKFTPVEGSIRIAMSNEAKQITITIKDSGPGIDPDDQSHVFDRFYKSDKAHNEKGSGLGLAIAKEIADSLGEKLWLKSSSSEGSEFAFTIQKS